MPRAQLLLLLAVMAVIVGVLLYGLGYTLVQALGPRREPTTPGSATIGAEARRDLIAGAPMARVPQDAGFTPGVAIDLPAAIRLPQATGLGAAQVPTGFPHTPEGAAAQLAAIEERVLGAMSVPLALEVYSGWAVPGGVGATDWTQTRNVASFLTHARQTGNVMDASTVVAVSTAAFQVKGTDGPDWVVACVLLDIRAAGYGETRMGYGTCERLEWVGDRWLIGPGTPPTPAPSTWPGSDASVRAGWRPVTTS